MPSSWAGQAAVAHSAARHVKPRSRRGPRLQAGCVAALVLILLVFGLAMQGTMLPTNAGSSLGGSSPRAVILADTNATLKADAGPDLTITQGMEAVLDGSASTGNITNYTWTFTYGGSNNTLPGKVLQLKLANPGIYNFTLTVNDSKGGHSSDVAQVTVEKKPFNLLGSYWQEIVIGSAVVAIVAIVYAVVTGRIAAVPESTQEKLKLGLKRWAKISSQLVHNPMGLTGVLILAFFIAMAVFGPLIAPYKVDLTAVSPFPKLQKPSMHHWLGIDDLQQDIFSELLYGARTSMIVGIFSAIIASVLGAVVGLYSGYVGGWKDEVIMRANDVMLSIPWLVLMIVVAAMLKVIDLTGIILIIGLTGWSTTARMVRAQVLSLKERQFVERAKAIGASDLAIIRRHIMPNAFPLVFANTILTVAVSILSEATLSFLGLRPANTVTWGTMLSRAHDAQAFNIGMQGWIVLPGLCIVAVVLGFTLLGYALDDIMNPKLRKR
jgi:peptide/nickel transport system permease protein